MEGFLHLPYPAPLQVILAYNTPRDLPVEAALRAIARRDPRFLPLRVEGSASKAQNVNVALAAVTGEFVGIFDADHHPAADSFERAWRWLSHGYDVVQGHCVVRNGDDSWLARVVAVEFETTYAVSHPGRARLHDFGVFGGSNGFWRTDALRRTRMRPDMLTEDIDASMRLLATGGRIAYDPALLSTELAPVTVRALWNQRLRWGQGWLQVAVRRLRVGLRSPHLSRRQKLGLVHLLVWPQLSPWLSLQILPVVVYWIWRQGGVAQVDWLVPIFVLSTLFALSSGPGQTFFAYLLAAPTVRRHRSWFLLYLLVGSLAYPWFKHLVTLVAQAKELLRERQWKVTPRPASGVRRPT